MPERFARVGPLEICFETFGGAGDPPLLLIMGLGTQMVAWHDDFCRELAARGYFVIRHDNRDIGRSSQLTGVEPPGLLALLRRNPGAAPYTLGAMAADSVGVLDALGLERAHVVGVSMGGMIAQRVAIEHPRRTRSLVSMMSNSGERWHGQPALSLYPTLLGGAPRERSSYIVHAVQMFTRLSGRGYEPNLADLREIAERSFDRGGDPRGPARQLGAIVADGDRRPLLARLRLPATVVHGLDDRLVNPSGGRATARAIAGATLVEIPGLGHGLPRAAWPEIIAPIVATAERADARGALV